MKVNVKEVDIFRRMGNVEGDREGRSQQMTHQANLILQKANDEKRDYLVRALTKSVETNTKIRGLLQTSLSETDLSYSIQMEDAYTMAVQMVNDLRRVIQIGDGIIVKNGEAKRYGRIIEPLDVPVEIHYINGLFKIQIPTLPSRGIKKDSDLKAIEDAVHNAIERFFEHNVEIAAQARKFAGKKYVVHEQYVLPVSETIDIDRIDFSNIIDMLSIEFCYGYDDSDYLRKHVQTVKNWGTRSYANLYIVLEDEYKEKLEWIERNL